MAIYYISNFKLANARKMCGFIFGDFLESVNLPKNGDRCFEIRVHKVIKSKSGDAIIEHKIEDYVMIKEFKKYWGPQWKIIYTTEEEL